MISKCDNINQSVSFLKEGYTCSESIVLTYAGYLGYDIETAVKMACGLSGGLAQGKTCGAVVASFMVLSYRYSSGDPGDHYSRDMSYQMIQEFTHRYIKRNQTITCRELLLKNNIDFTDQKEMKNLRAKGICEFIVRDAAEILEEILQEDF